jgi:hypothetical protein
MTAAAINSRLRPSAPPVKPVKKGRRSAGAIAIVGVPVMLILLLAWQVGSSLLRTEIAVRDAVAVSRVSLEPSSDPAGSRVDLVLVDRVGQATTVTGDLTVKLREPDGTVWQTTRSVSVADFGPLPDGGLLAGRLGYSVAIPASDWVRAPRRGGAATVSVSVQPAERGPFSTVAEERFP